MSPWAKLAIAILVEVGATISLRQSDNLSNLGWTAAMIVGYIASFWLLAQITDQLEIGTIYAVWSGAGTAIVAALGVWLFDERVTGTRIAGVILIILGVVALNLDGGHGSASETHATGDASPRVPSAGD
ncbi:MAG: multidrug efflux SMR transporter [Solirubrobacteraceae bacterium]|nr:multidrug efflux SMR transporter [Patulibacter sp.]